MYSKAQQKRSVVWSWVMLVLISVASSVPIAALDDPHTMPASRDAQSPAAPVATDAPQILVVLAETTDARGRSPLSRYQAMAQSVNRYYALNSYGQVGFSFLFLNADGEEGTHDWHDISPTLMDYEGQEAEFAMQALAQALDVANLRRDVYLERAIVVCASSPEALESGRVLFPCVFTPAYGYLRTKDAAGEIILHVAHLIVVGEEDELGTWVHELGHTLPCEDKTACEEGYISDRYKSCDIGRWRKRGQVGYWDLMGFGNLWGEPAGACPTHMSSYTKQAAGWLRYTSAQPGQEYVLTALEHQSIGDSILRLDDPLSDDPLCYYILEARDRDVAFGAPESGVVIYHVTYDHSAGHAVVNLLSPQQGTKMENHLGLSYGRPTLHGVAQADGATEYVGNGFTITLLAESFSPYFATVRIERS